MKKVLILVKENELMEHVVEILLSCDKRLHICRADNLPDAYQFIMNHNIELIIVDAILDKKKTGDAEGIQFIANLRQLDAYTFIPVILLSALADEKLYAYSYLHCYGFLEKPFSKTQLEKLIQEALGFSGQKRNQKYVHFRQGGIFYPIRIEEIVYIEHRCRNMYVHTIEDELVIPYHTCEDTLAQLEDWGFLLCARGVIVNRDYIYALDTTNHYVVLKDNLGCLELGRKYYKEIKMSLAQGIPIRKAAKKDMKKEALFDVIR